MGERGQPGVAVAVAVAVVDDDHVGFAGDRRRSVHGPRRGVSQPGHQADLGAGAEDDAVGVLAPLERVHSLRAEGVLHQALRKIGWLGFPHARRGSLGVRLGTPFRRRGQGLLLLGFGGGAVGPRGRMRPQLLLRVPVVLGFGRGVLYRGRRSGFGRHNGGDCREKCSDHCCGYQAYRSGFFPGLRHQITPVSDRRCRHVVNRTVRRGVTNCWRLRGI